MRRNLVVFFIIVLFSCSKKMKVLTGSYISSCRLHAFPSVILEINADSSFKYTFAYFDEAIKGEWTKQGDTLFLTSTQFEKGIDEPLSPKKKNTSYSFNIDAYLIKNENLLAIDSNHFAIEKCILGKQ